MTNHEKQVLKERLLATALYFSQELDDSAVQLFVEDLEDLDFHTVLETLKQLRRDPKTTRLPLPAIIRARIQPPESDEDESKQAAARILMAIGKFGWSNSEQAKQFIGRLGWEVVQYQGGWTRVCELVDDNNFNSFQAQWRDLAGSIRRRAAAGLHNTPPTFHLPEDKNSLPKVIHLPDQKTIDPSKLMRPMDDKQ